MNQKDIVLVVVPPAAGMLDVTPCRRSIFFAVESIDSNSSRLSSLQTSYSTL